MSIDVRRPLKKLIPVLKQARQENLNEANTVQRLIMVLQEVLGYDPLTEITRELEVKDKYVDLALKIDGVVRIFIEAKAALHDVDQPQLDAQRMRWWQLGPDSAGDFDHEAVPPFGRATPAVLALVGQRRAEL